MAGRRQRRRRNRRRRGRNRAKGCLYVFVVTIGLCALTAFALPWAHAEFVSFLQGILEDGIRETVNTAARQETVFPELTVTVEEVAGDFYYQQLSGEEQTVYRELLQGVQEMKESITIHAGRDEHPEKVYEYLLYDRPELFFCDGSSKMTVYEDHTEFYPGYTCTLSEKEQKQAQIETASEECIAGISGDASEYDKIRYVYEYIVNTVDYDENAPDNQNIYSALVGKNSVCAGYSRAAQYLLGKIGIECIYVVGTAQGQSAHAWNIVSCSGKYYQMDVTFADPVFLSAETGEKLPGDTVNYDYLCCTDNEIFTDHKPSTDISYPVCDSDDLNYYKMNGMYYEAFDPQIILGAMNDGIYAGEETFVCKFSGAEVFAGARSVMVGDLLPRAAQTLASAYGLKNVKYTYVEDETHHKVTVFWNYE